MFDLFKYKLRKIKSNAWKSKGKAIVYNLQTEIKGDYQDFLTSDYIKELTTRVDKGKKVLDLGCGTGVLSLAHPANVRPNNETRRTLVKRFMKFCLCSKNSRKTAKKSW